MIDAIHLLPTENKTVLEIAHLLASVQQSGSDAVNYISCFDKGVCSHPDWAQDYRLEAAAERLRIMAYDIAMLQGLVAELQNPPVAEEVDADHEAKLLWMGA